MANNYSQIVATETVPCSAELFNKLKKILDESRDDLHGMEVEYDSTKSRLHMFARDSGNLADLPEAAMTVIQEILRNASITHWTFGCAYTCDKHEPGQFGGGQERILDDGTIEYESHIWESEEREHLQAVKCAHADLVGIMQCYQRGDFSTHDWSAHARSIAELEEKFPELAADGATRIVYQVDGYYPDRPNAPGEIDCVLMISGEEHLPSRDDIQPEDEVEAYYDEEIHFYGVTAEMLAACVVNKEPLGDFVPVEFSVESIFKTKKVKPEE